MQSRSIAERADAQAGPDAQAGDTCARQHAMWAAVAPSWGDMADEIDERGAAVARKLLDSSDPQPGERVLELACGPGGVGIAAAERVAPNGEVVLSDVAAEMTAIAAERARRRGVGNVTARVLELERIAEPDASYDVVLCREGLMLATDPSQAAREIRRVLRPGGRAAFAVWGPRERNPWLGTALDAASAELGRPVPPPGIPGPFSLSGRDELAATLTGAGLTEVGVTEMPVPLRAASFEDWWSRVTSLAGPFAKILEALPDEHVDAMTERARAAVAPYRSADGLEFPGLTLVAGARRG